MSSQSIHKEKFNVPISAENYKDFHTFKTHFTKFTAINEIARGKGLAENPEVNFSRVNKGASGGVEPRYVKSGYYINIKCILTCTHEYCISLLYLCHLLS